MNGKKDTGFVSAEKLDWSSVLDPFLASDIGDTSFLGKYKCSVFDEYATNSKVYYYEAIDPNVFTRLLQVNFDLENRHINGIYIETFEKTNFGDRAHRLIYRDGEVIDIREIEHSKLLPSKNLAVSYRF